MNERVRRFIFEWYHTLISDPVTSFVLVMPLLHIKRSCDLHRQLHNAHNLFITPVFTIIYLRKYHVIHSKGSEVAVFY